MIDFSGRVLLLTGANGGISRAIATMFFNQGAHCFLTDIDEQGVTDFAQSLDPSGTRCVGMKQDVTLSHDADLVMEAVKSKFGHLDYLVTSAGFYRDQMIHSMTDTQWQDSLGINLNGVFYTCRAAIPLLADGGAIVNISSMSGHRGSFMHSDYAASKGGVLAFTRTLALELAPRIRVNAISPGLIDTPMVQPLMDKQGPKLMEATPLKRLGSPREVAGAVAYLCSDLASFVTAETIHVNGGLYVVS
ncbi:MAG: SDR family oxidoreductase [Opitutaceae bacterium]|nr:SDR family oxidoreductase [Opitutaceae bacterium]